MVSNPSEKYESHLGWWHSKYGKISQSCSVRRHQPVIQFRWKSHHKYKLNGLVEGKILTGNQPDFRMISMGFSCKFSQQNPSIDMEHDQSISGFTLDLPDLPIKKWTIYSGFIVKNMRFSITKRVFHVRTQDLTPRLPQNPNTVTTKWWTLDAWAPQANYRETIGKP